MMDNHASINNKRIAKNTIVLYFRMLFLMIVSLYTSRVILNALGVEDYGIYNVVGGVVTMFSLLSTSISSSISRFLTFELGTGDENKLSKVFSSSVTIQAGMALLIIMFAETIGLWFVNTKLVIPDARMQAANLVYHLSILTFAVNLISIPYNAAIIAHERMSAFAYISIVEALVKLSVAWLIVISPIDRLVFFAAGLAVLSVILRVVYGYYCKQKFSECTYHFIYDHDLLKQMFGFAGWNFIGATSGILRDQGGSIIINLFFGPSVNAARALASKVNAAISSFVSNFMTALNPQITKSYAQGDNGYLMTLLFQGARLSFYILLLLSLPVLFNTHWLLVTWLRLVPEHTVAFVQLSLIFAMMESISNPLITAMLATGKIRNYQLLVGGLQLMNLPVSYICLLMGGEPELVIVVAIVIGQLCLYARLYMLRGMIGLPVMKYLKNVYFNVIVVGILSAVIPYSISSMFEEGVISFGVITMVCLICTLAIEFYIGSTKSERCFVMSKCRSLIRNYR